MRKLTKKIYSALERLSDFILGCSFYKSKGRYRLRYLFDLVPAILITGYLLNYTFGGDLYNEIPIIDYFAYCVVTVGSTALSLFVVCRVTLPTEMREYISKRTGRRYYENEWRKISDMVSEECEFTGREGYFYANSTSVYTAFRLLLLASYLIYILVENLNGDGGGSLWLQ